MIKNKKKKSYASISNIKQLTTNSNKNRIEETKSKETGKRAENAKQLEKTEISRRECRVKLVVW